MRNRGRNPLQVRRHIIVEVSVEVAEQPAKGAKFIPAVIPFRSPAKILKGALGLFVDWIYVHQLHPPGVVRLKRRHCPEQLVLIIGAETFRVIPNIVV
jgi:hypothetical protein